MEYFALGFLLTIVLRTMLDNYVEHYKKDHNQYPYEERR